MTDEKTQPDGEPANAEGGGETIEAHVPAPSPPPREKLAATTPLARYGSRMMLVPRDMQEALEVAKLMSKAVGMVGPHLVGNPGGCLAVVIQAAAWGMNPFSVAAKTYVAEKPEVIARKIMDGEPIPPVSYEAQLIHAVVLALAPIEGRPDITYEGEGQDMRCVVSATFKGALTPSVLRSEPLSKLRNDRGSPLWAKKPEQQLAYNAVRDWARRYCPDVIMGVYTPDELQDYAPAEPPRKIDPFAGEGPKQITAATPIPVQPVKDPVTNGD